MRPPTTNQLSRNRNTGASKTRGRPPTVDRDAVLRAVIDVFWERGHDGASLDALCAAGGVSRPTLYALFGDKAALFVAAIDAYAAGIGSEPLRAFEASEDIREATRAFLDVSLCNNTAPSHPAGCLIGCCAVAVAGTVPEVAGRLAAIGESMQKAVRVRFAREIDAGRLSVSPDALTRAALLVDLMNAQALRARAGASRQVLRRGLDGRVDAVLAECSSRAAP